MSCPSPDKLKQLALTGEVEDEESLAAHLDECDECRRLLARLESLAAKPKDLLGAETAGREARQVDSLIGSKLGKYTILERVAASSGAIVYRAIQEHTDRTVAIKVLSGVRFSDSGLQAWKREARLAGRIDHPHVVKILEADRTEGFEYCVFEWIAGGSLADRLKSAQLDPREAAEFTLQVARGCEELHAKNIIHRDIKPSNVLIDQSGNAKLADFGVARSVEETISTATGQLVGTPGYMSPEQLGVIRGNVDQRTDVYGVGALLYALLTGRSPFVGSTAVEIVANASQHEIAPPSTERRVPRDLETICLKCLERSPTDRYDTASDMAEDLQRFLRDEPIVARRPPLVRRIQQTVRRHRLLSAVCSLGILACILFTGLSFWMDHLEARSLAAMRLQNVLRSKPSEFAITLDAFKRCRLEAIQSALAEAKQQPNSLTPPQRMRLAMTDGASRSDLVRLVTEFVQEIPSDEFPPLFDWFAEQSDEFDVSVAEVCREAIAQADGEPLLKLASTLATAAPEHFGEAEAARVARALTTPGMSEATVWKLGFMSVASGLVDQILLVLEQERSSIARQQLIGWAWDLCFCAQRGDRAVAAAKLDLQLAELLQAAEPDQIFRLVHRLPLDARPQQIIEHLSAEAIPTLEQFEPIRSKLPDALHSLKPYLDEYHGYFSKGVSLLPTVPMTRWPELQQVCERLSLNVIGFRPAIVDGKLLVAVTLAEGISQETYLTVDAPEEKIASIAEKYDSDGIYPISIWARPAIEDDWAKLLVSVVWQKAPHIQHIVFDETLEDLGIPLKLTQENYHEANHYTTVRLGVAEDIAATEEIAKTEGRERLEVYPVYKHQRSVSIVRDRAAWILPEHSREPFRLQLTWTTRFNHAQIEASERNFAFQNCVRKICPGPFTPEQFLRASSYLTSIGFGPEGVYVAEDAAGSPEIASRWSAEFREYSQEAELQTTRAIFACLLLGEPRLAIRVFNHKLDRTLATTLQSYGKHLDPRSTAAIVKLIDSAESTRAKYSTAIMLGYATRQNLDDEITERLDVWRSESNHAGIIGALNWLPNDSEVAEITQRPSEYAQGQIIRAFNGHNMVVLDPRGQPVSTGGERVYPYDEFAAHNIDLLDYKFAVGTHEVTRGQFRKFVEATGACDMPPTIAETVADSHPVTKIEYYHMLQYCRWLSDQAGVSVKQPELPKIDEIRYDMDLEQNLVRSSGFRLPTYQELNMATGAYSTGDHFLGRTPLFEDYANVSSKIESDMQPVGQLLSNPFGLFDCYGNVLEACLLRRHGQSRVMPERDRRLRHSLELLGGSFLTATRYASSGGVLSNSEDRINDIHVGFRIARTLKW